MSAGPFSTSRYELNSDNGGGVARIRVQPETLALTIDSVANAAPTGEVTLPVSAQVGKGKREYGIGARTVTLEFTGTLPDGYSGDNVVVPVLTPAAYAAYGFDKEGTYLGSPVKVVGRSPEDVR